jgi:hypothetical protein
MFCALLSAILISFSCSSAPAGPEKGTPGFYWAAAKETYAAGDYNKTLEHLDNILATDNEFSARALPWDLVITSGMASGFMELADDYAVGARVNKADPLGFRRQVTAYRGEAGRLSLHFAELAARVGKLPDGPVSLAFVSPKGSAGQVVQLSKVTNGILLAQPEAETAQKRTLERGVLMAACSSAGAPDDAARTEQILKAGDAKIPRAAFQLAVANSLYTMSQLYVRDKLDDPDKMKIFCERAAGTLQGVAESKESKELTAKIDKVLKKGK